VRAYGSQRKKKFKERMNPERCSLRELFIPKFAGTATTRSPRFEKNRSRRGGGKGRVSKSTKEEIRGHFKVHSSHVFEKR